MSSNAELTQDREASIQANVDPTGRKWLIGSIRGSALLRAVPEPYQENFSCPENMRGHWTSTSKLQEEIKIYLQKAWDVAEAKKLEASRIKEAAKEAALRTAADKRSEKKKEK